MTAGAFSFIINQYVVLGDYSFCLTSISVNVSITSPT